MHGKQSDPTAALATSFASANDDGTGPPRPTHVNLFGEPVAFEKPLPKGHKRAITRRANASNATRFDGLEIVGLPPHALPGAKPRRLELFQLAQSAEEAAAMLRKAGYTSVIVLPVLKAER